MWRQFLLVVNDIGVFPDSLNRLCYILYEGPLSSPVATRLNQIIFITSSLPMSCRMCPELNYFKMQLDSFVITPSPMISICNGFNEVAKTFSCVSLKMVVRYSDSELIQQYYPDAALLFSSLDWKHMCGFLIRFLRHCTLKPNAKTFRTKGYVSFEDTSGLKCKYRSINLGDHSNIAVYTCVTKISPKPH